MSLHVKLFNESLKQMHLFPACLLECNKLQKLAMKRLGKTKQQEAGDGALPAAHQDTNRAGQTKLWLNHLHSWQGSGTGQG